MFAWKFLQNSGSSSRYIFSIDTKSKEIVKRMAISYPNHGHAHDFHRLRLMNQLLISLRRDYHTLKKRRVTK